ncbi:MAG: phosphate acyltransferase PlsX [Limnochordales bacterium]|nr:phosphate acyltransferase PlsX [Limnochordales bacterium]
MPVRVALDTMGGDLGPAAVVEGAWRALVADTRLEIALVGPTDLLQETLATVLARAETITGDLPRESIMSRLSCVEARDVVTMDDHPVEALRRKPRSTLMVTVEQVAEGKADAFVSAGNTGAVMAAALFRLGRFPGIDRPALGISLPNQRRGYTLLVDAGANVDCRPVHLLQFAVMGYAYARGVMGIANPRIGLLSVGSEPAKGSEAVRKANEMLAGSQLPFIGNVEGMDVWNGSVDVVVCDGFVGNVLIKSAEGLVETLLALLGPILGNASTGQAPSGLLEALKPFDWTEHGAAPLLGLNGIGLVAHGRSNARAIEQAVRKAVLAVRGSVLEQLERALPDLQRESS